jgi:hypothetical protein
MLEMVDAGIIMAQKTHVNSTREEGSGYKRTGISLTSWKLLSSLELLQLSLYIISTLFALKRWSSYFSRRGERHTVRGLIITSVEVHQTVKCKHFRVSLRVFLAQFMSP